RLVWKEVTDAVRSERERSRLADLLRGVIDASPAAIVLFAPVYDESNAVVDFRYEVVNGVTERLLDMSEAEIIGKLLSEVLPNHGRAVTAYRDVFETGTPKVTEVHVTDLGIDKWFRLTIGKAGDRVAVTGSDITAYKEALEELSVKEERLELAVTGGSDGLWDRDLVTGEMYFSPRWCEMLGYTTGEFASGEVTWAGLVHPDDFREARRRVVRVLEGLDDSYQSEHRLRHRDGTYRWFRARGRVVRNEEGRPVRFVGLSSDISDRKRLEEDMATARDAAEKANAAKSQFLANMSHELRTPLNAIIGFSEILAGGIVNVDLDQQRSYASHILDGGRHLLALINDILDLSKAEAGKLEPQPEYFKLAEVVSIANDMLAGSARKKGVRIDTDIQGDISKLYADRRMVLQVLINIVSNAIKFTGENGRVAIEGQHMADGSVRIRIRDTGIGISPNDIETVLSPFGQVDNKLNRSHMGTGLGLPLSRRLMELHGGTLQLDSTPGEGTTVTLVFPPEMLLAGL
ncbi:MAG: ATP-binding protein, partial [Alphaproteobacteria bacterium]